MRTRPPSGNVRRPPAFGRMFKFEFIGKDGSTVLANSYLARSRAFELEFDPDVLRYMSQPRKLTLSQGDRKPPPYFPDYQIWRQDGSLSIEEVMLEKNRNTPSGRLREQEGAHILQREGLSYHVSTDASLGSETQRINLHTFYRFSAAVYCDERVLEALLRDLSPQKKWHAIQVRDQAAEYLNIPRGVVFATLCWMVWHQELETDMGAELFIQCGRPNPAALVWRKENQNG